MSKKAPEPKEEEKESNESLENSQEEPMTETQNTAKSSGNAQAASILHVRSNPTTAATGASPSIHSYADYQGSQQTTHHQPYRPSMMGSLNDARNNEAN